MSNTTPDWLSQGATPAPTNTSAPDWLTQGATLANPEAEQDGAFMRGLKTAGQSAKITGQLAAQDAAGVAQSIKEAELYRQENPGTKEGDELAKAWDSGDGGMGGVANVAGEFAKDYREAKGFWGGVKATGANLEAMRQGIVSQLGNSIAPMVGMVAGGAAGAAAGSAAPVVGNVAGGLAGGWAGASIGNTLVEGGGQVQDALQKAGIDPLDTAAVEKFIAENGNQILGQSAIKGGVIGAVDAATAGAGGKLLKAPVSAAMNRAFAALGIDMADKVAVNAAIKSGEIAKRVAADPIYQASQKGAQKLIREGTVAALDPAGEFTGEYVGQGVATGDWDTKNAALEALSSVGQSGMMYAGQKGYQYATNPLRGSGSAANQNSEAATPAAPEQPLQLGNSPDPLIQFRDGTVARQSEIDAHLASLPEGERPTFTAQILGYAPQQADEQQLTSGPGATQFDGTATEQPSASVAAPDFGTSLGAQPEQQGEGLEFQRQIDTNGLSLERLDSPFTKSAPATVLDRQALARQGAYPISPTPAPVLDTRRLSEKLGLSSNRGGLEAAAAMAVDSGASPISQAANTNAFQQGVINGTQTQEAQQAVAGQPQATGTQGRVAAAPKIRAVKLKDGTTAHVNEADLTSGASLLRTFTADGKPRAVRLPASNIAPAAPKVVLQNRNRATPASIAQMNAIASKPDFLRTGASNTMDNGAPIVFGDLPQKVAIGRAQMVADGNGQRVPTQYAVVEAQDLITSNHADGSPVAEYANGVDGKLRAVAGNGRAAGLKAAWQRGTAGQYGQELMQDAPNLGIAPEVLAQFEAPVLVRVMDAADVTPDMGDRSNVQAGLQMSAVEQASNDAQRLNLRDMEFDELGNPTAQTVMRFMQGMPVQERGNMLDSQGRATSQLLDRIRAAAFKQAYMSDSLVELAAQSADPEAKNILNGLAIVAGDMAQLAGSGDFDIRQVVTDAANMAVTAARTGQSLAQYLQTRQIDENPETVVVMQFMAQNVRSAKRIADGLRAWAELAQGQIAIARQNAEQDTMFGDTPTLSRRELFERLNNDNLTEIEQQQLIEQQRRAELAEQGAQRSSTERAGNADGASDGAESRGTEPTNAQDAGREQADFALERQTPEQIRAQEEAQAQAARDKAQADAQAAEAERKAVERQEVTQRSEAAANDFQLGQSAEDNLSGQGDIFTQQQEATPEAPPKTLKEGFERVRAKKAAGEAERASKEFAPAPNGGQDANKPATDDVLFLGEGETTTTATGRQTTPFPKWRYSTGRVTEAHLKAVDVWLLDNARLEAQARGDDFNERNFAHVLKNPSNIQQADKDGAELYLFNRLHGQAVSQEPVKNEKPAAARDSAESNTETAAAVNQPSRPDKWRGNKLQAAKVARDLGLKLDIPKISILDLVRAIDAHDAKANGQEVVAAPAKPKKNTPFAIGNTPSDTEKVTVRDGTVFLDKYEAIDYESGEPVTVPNGSTRGDVVKALRDAGAINQNTKVFGASGEQANDLAFSRNTGRKNDGIEGVRDLVVLHNLTEDNLRNAAKIGGLPVPSLGIAKSETPFSGYGNITLIGTRDMIDPQQGVPVYDRDAYTARFPEMHYKKPKRGNANALYERMQSLRELGDDGSRFQSMLFDILINSSSPTPARIAELFDRYNAPRMLYAQEVLGKTIKTPMRDVQASTLIGHDKELVRYWQKHRETFNRLEREMDGAAFRGTPEYKAFEKEIHAAINRVKSHFAQDDDATYKRISKRFTDSLFPNGHMDIGTRDRLIRDFGTYGKKEIDVGKLNDSVDKTVKRGDAGYTAWVNKQMAGLFDEPTITLRGKQVAPTLDNLVAAMTIGGTVGAEKTMTASAGKTSAMLGKRFKSVAEIQAARAQVVSSSQENDAKKSNDEILAQYRTSALAFFTKKDWRGEVDTWAGLDASMEALANAGKKGGADAAIRQALAAKGFRGVDAAVIDLAKQSIDALRNSPTEYFEAKPQRAVGIGEFRGAVLPRGTDPNVLELLAKHGVQVLEYGKGEGAREKAIATLAKRLDRGSRDVLFSATGDDAANLRTKPKGATTSTIRQAASRAYGKLLERLEAKGLVHVAQTEEAALQAAAKARAAKTGQSVGDALEGLRQSVQNSIVVWHGTPHRGIEKTGFKLNKIGTGEGAQAYGWGMYFAGDKDVAEGYRKALSADKNLPTTAFEFNGERYSHISPRGHALNLILNNGKRQALSTAREMLADAKAGRPYAVQNGEAHYREMVDFITGFTPTARAKIKAIKESGQLYGLDLPIEESDLLDWDKPLSEQPQKILDALKSVGILYKPSMTGSAFYQNIQRNPTHYLDKVLSGLELTEAYIYPDRGASMLLNALGIPGLRYLDGNSRADGKGSHNYVIWDEALLTPEAAQIDAKFSKDGAIEGFFDRQTGKSFLVADGLTEETAPATLMHEVGIHMAADGSMQGVFNRAAMLVKNSKDEFMNRVRDRMEAAGETSAEEAAAYIVTEYEKDRTNAPASIKQFMKDFMAAVRAWLFRNGFTQVVKEGNLTPADISAIARANARSLAQGGQVAPSVDNQTYAINEPNAPYETDLFGEKVQAPRVRNKNGVKPYSTPIGNIQPATALSDTAAPDGEYYVKTIVGSEVERKLGASRISTAADAARATAYLYRSAVERFDGIVTDKDGRPLAVVGGFKGALSQASVYPGTIMGEAIRVPGAARIWFSHNHPSGSSTLSSADKTLFTRLVDIFNGSGIEPMGMLAVSNGEFSSIATNEDPVQSQAIPSPSVVGAKVPVIERELAINENGREEVNSPAVAMDIARKLHSAAGDGIMLFDSQMRLAAWVPISDVMRGTLRHTGGLAAVYRAISESNAGSAILVHDGSLNAIHRDSRSITVGNNIAAALRQLDVSPLDIINIKTLTSAAQSGGVVAAGPVYSKESPAEAQVRELVAQYANTEGAPTEAEIREAVRQYHGTERTYGGQDAYAKAKADGKTKLNYGQWVQVRTPNFKAWFGDWENDPANASKVTDPDTGEPMVVYHGTGSDISQFDGKQTMDGSFWFTNDPKKLSDGEVGAAATGVVMPVYLQSKKLAGWDEYDSLTTDQLIQDGFDGVKLDEDYIIFRPEQIKSAIGNNGNFDGANPDIRFGRSNIGQQGAQNGQENGMPRGLSATSTAQSRALEDKINADLRRLGDAGDGLFRAASIPQNQLPDALSRALGALRAATGTQVHIFRNLTPQVLDFNGVSFRDGTVHINETSQNPATLTAAHEWLHNLRRTNPDLYRELADEVARQGRLPEYQQRLKRDGETRWKNMDVVEEELTAAAVSDALTDPVFLQRLAERDQGAFRRVAKAFLEFLKTLTAGWKDQGSNAYLQDVEAFRDKLEQVLDKLPVAKQKPGAIQALFLRVWHGTPHRGIEKTGFKLDKIGTGDGAQAYGWGMHFAESELEAKLYVEGADGQLYQLDLPVEELGLLDWDKPIYEQPNGIKQAILRLFPNDGETYRNDLWERAQEDFYENGPSGYDFDRLQAAFNEAIESDGYGEVFGSGVWDELKEAAPSIAWKSEIRKAADGSMEGLTGGGIYRELVNTYGSARAASEKLLDEGVQGAKFTAGDNATQNYVIWDEALLTPEKAQIEAMYSRGQNQGASVVDGAALKRQFDETARAYGGQDAYAKAKADGKTKLNYGQWVQVRTPNFKAWFGDWENDPANASKVTDRDTGEPMVVYHGTGADFSVFDAAKIKRKAAGAGFYFTTDPGQRGYAEGDGANVMPVYLLIKNPPNNPALFRTDENYDGLIFPLTSTPGVTHIAVRRSEQIKSAISNNGNFDPTDDNIANFGQKSKVKQSGSKAGTPTDRAVMDMVRDGKTAEDVLRLIAGTSRSKFSKQVARLLLKTGAAPSVHIVGDLGSKGGFKHLAKYSRKNHALSMTEAATGRAEQIFLHEMIHAATLMALDRKSLPSVQMRVLFNHVKKQGGAAGQYGMTNVGEFVSEAFTNPKFQQALRGMKAPAQSPLHSAWDYLVRTIKSILGLPNDSTDALSAALEIGVAVMRENMALRKKGVRGSGADANAGIDQTQTPEFKRWFGDSKVVDADGKPLVVYHGTDAEFNVFQPSSDGVYGPGAYLTKYSGDASTYGSNVMPVYASLQNPYTATPGEARRAKKEGGTKAWSRAIQDKGHDGIVLQDMSVVVAFRPGQIKSAIGNNGNFDQEDDDIAYFGAGVWQSPEPTKFDQWTYLLQDKQIDTKRVLNAIKNTGQQVDDAQDVYLQETLYHGRTAKRVKDFAEQEERPLMELMRDKGLSLGQVEEYLHARHAPEANKALAERNPSAEVIAANLKAAQAAGDEGEAAKWRNAKPYTGTEEDRLALSGMSDAEAAAVMAALTPEQRTNLQAAAKMVDAIVAKTRQTFVDYGLETQETVDAWGKAWAHYVPLMREQPEDTGMAGMGTGQGFSVKGKETKGRTGSTKKVVDILANINMQRERAIVRGEKNRVAMALLGLVKANQNKDFWRVATAGEVPSSKVVDERTGLVRTQIDPLYKSRDNALVVKVDGQEQVILFNEDNARAMRMAAALKNMDAANLEGMLGNVASVTRYLAAINTQYNPIFGIVNMVRDFQEAAINLQATPLAGKQKQVLGQALTAVWQVGKELRAQREGKTTGSEWGKLWEDFQAHGGQTGYRDMFTNSADRSRALQALLQPDAWADTKWGKFFSANGTLKAPMEFVRKTALRPLLDLLSDYNEAIENGVRLSAYKTAIEQGMSRERAAELAKNLTVNFNRKGQVAQQVGALYAFFNASVQGTARMGQTLFNMESGQPKTMRLSPLGKKIVGGAVLLGSVQALLLAAAGFGEDEPPEFIRERNLVIPNPLADKGYTTIPMPLGYHVLVNLGRIPTEYALGGFKGGAKRAVSILDVLADIYNPLGGGGLSMQTISPTVLDPFAALAENKDFTGRPIAKESFNKTTPGHALGRDTSSFLANGLAQAINYATGGTEYTRGELSPTPDQIDYLLGQALGGVGREASKVSQTAQALATGDDLPWHKVPLIGRFYGSADTPAAVQSAYYSTMDDVRRHAAEVKGFRNDGRGQEAVAYMQENPQAGMHFAANAAERQVKKLRERISDLKEQGAPREAVKAVETQMVEVMQRFSVAVENRKKLVSA